MTQSLHTRQGGVVAMDEIVYNALVSYYHALGLKGYMSNSQSEKLLILSFYRDFVFEDYRGMLSCEDYHIIERALDCLWGSTCLIPYPDYLKMGKLELGKMTELASRVKALEDTNVLKSINADDTVDSDIIITEESDE